MKGVISKIGITISSLFFLFSIGSNLFAQNQSLKNFTGRWISEDFVEASLTRVSFKARNEPLKFILVVEENDGKLLALFNSLNKNINIRSGDISVSGDSIIIRLNEIDAIYKAVLNSDKDQFTGKLISPGRFVSLGFRKDNEPIEERQITSKWIGKCLDEADSLNVILVTYKTVSGTDRSSIDLPGKGLNNISVTNFIAKNDSLRFEAEALNAKYEGRIFKESNSINGKWIQNNRSVNLEFKKE